MTRTLCTILRFLLRMLEPRVYDVDARTAMRAAGLTPNLMERKAEVRRKPRVKANAVQFRSKVK